MKRRNARFASKITGFILAPNGVFLLLSLTNKSGCFPLIPSQQWLQFCFDFDWYCSELNRTEIFLSRSVSVSISNFVFLWFDDEREACFRRKENKLTLFLETLLVVVVASLNKLICKLILLRENWMASSNNNNEIEIFSFLLLELQFNIVHPLNGKNWNGMEGFYFCTWKVDNKSCGLRICSLSQKSLNLVWNRNQMQIVVLI